MGVFSSHSLVKQKTASSKAADPIAIPSRYWLIRLSQSADDGLMANLRILGGSYALLRAARPDAIIGRDSD